MALSLPDDLPTDHITWETRGYFGDAPGDSSPVTAPGALEGLSYSKVFRRTGAGQFAIRGINSDDDEDNFCGTVWSTIRALGVNRKQHGGMFNAQSETVDLLDGGLYYFAADYGFSGTPRLNLYGNRALRLVCHRLGLRQPKKFVDEVRVPSAEELERELLEQLETTNAAD